MNKYNNKLYKTNCSIVYLSNDSLIHKSDFSKHEIYDNKHICILILLI